MLCVRQKPYASAALEVEEHDPADLEDLADRDDLENAMCDNVAIQKSKPQPEFEIDKDSLQSQRKIGWKIS